ncbi:MAG: NAD(P)/FAD-dependent oxidoreductase [Desulfobacterales bacterium]|nr:NAD(P)/FAD-dependent oxidoreductase [Desulfobacterales bacterium]
MTQRAAIIIGAGPAGLTAAHELLERTDMQPIVFEASGDIGGISKTVVYKGNRIDIGGHRFFSKSDRVMDWWQRMLPLQGRPARDDRLLGRPVPLSDREHAPDPETEERVMLVRSRLSRILFDRKLFDYPITLNAGTLKNLGLRRLARMGLAYLAVRLSPIREVKSLEDFFINRFGRELYATFFRDYTEKVWGVPCRKIQSEWGSQRVKNLSVTRVLAHALRTLGRPKDSILQKEVETSLIGRFLYPKLGPGQLWEEVARRVTVGGGELHLGHEVVGLRRRDGAIVAVDVLERATGRTRRCEGDFFFSTMPMQDLFRCLDGVDPECRRVAEGLRYRDFISVGLLVRRLKLRNGSGVRTLNGLIPDNWIYVQEPDVALGRLQVFNNWSPYLVKDPDTVWLGLEYFCTEGDAFWRRPDEEIARLAAEELARLEVIEPDSVLDRTVIRMPKAYPAYFGTYDELHVLRAFADRIPNLFLIGRNGMHRYNNQDHSMLTAMQAVDHAARGIASKDAIWNVNVGDDYHEER